MAIEDQEVERRLAQFQSIAKRAGIKLTHQRLEIFRAVAASAEHPSAETVYRTVRATMPTVSLDTVYRTLWLLSDLGLVKTLGPRQEGVRFDANLAHHHHYRCVRCGLIRDFESTDLNTLQIPDAVNRFGQVVSAHVEVQGICAKCLGKLAEAQTTQTPNSQEAKEGADDEREK